MRQAETDWSPDRRIPDLRCTSVSYTHLHIRFDYLLNYARRLGADYLATGHYARLRRGADGKVQLLKGVDEAKDQSYVLSVLGQAELNDVLFPIGDYPKPEVRRMAAARGLPIASKHDSMDLCFIFDDDYRRFLRNWAAEAMRPGPIAVSYTHLDVYKRQVTGNVKTSAGESWAWRGCAGDAVTVTANSDQFTPYLELFDPTAEETLMESNTDNDSRASIAGVEIPTTGVYLLIVAGEQRNNRGAYTLSLMNSASSAINSAPALTPASTRQANSTATPRAAATCTVLANPNLNVRSGPGTTLSLIHI